MAPVMNNLPVSRAYARHVVTHADKHPQWRIEMCWRFLLIWGARNA
jgi:hypothetical protein